MIDTAEATREDRPPKVPSGPELPGRDVWMMRLAGWGVIAVVLLITVLEEGSALSMVGRVLPLLMFGVVFSLDDRPDASIPQRHARLALESALVLVALMVGSGAAFLLMFLLSARAPFLLPPRHFVPWLAGYSATVLALYVASAGLAEGLLAGAAQSAGFAFFAAAALALVRVDEARRETRVLLGELQDAHAALRASASRAEELAVSEERNRMARDLHDTLGHRLTVAIVQLEGAERLIRTAPERAEQIVGTVRAQLREGMSELRATVATLRDPLAAGLALPLALRQLAEDFERATGLELSVEVEALPARLPDAQRRVIFMSAKEGLTNVQRHAAARRVSLWAGVRDGALELRIEDDGAGPDGSPPGFGRQGMAERAARLGGTVALRARPEGGARLVVRVPWAVEAEGEGTSA